MMASKRRVAPAWLLAASVCVPMSVAAQPAGPPAPQQSRSPGETAKKATPQAKSTKAANPKGKGDTLAAQDNVEAGINALEAGKIDAAVASLTSALSASTLPASQTARALYYRGLAYRRQSKPALAIADLTSALWLKGGLTDQQRQDALQNRAAAYREAGLPDQAEADYARSASASAAGPAQSPPASAPASATMATQALPGAAAGPAPRPGVGAKAIERTPEVMPDGFALRAAAPANSPASAAASAPVAAPAPAASAPTQGTSGGLGGFFGSLFGGGGSAGSSAQQAASSPPPAQVAGPWSVRTQVASSSPPQTAQPSPAPAIDTGRIAVASLPAAAAPKTTHSQPVKPAPSAAAPALAPAKGGAYRVQVATVRSNDEALGVAAMFQDRYGRELGNRSASVDQTVMGNMGTLYRVRIGPFATANESRQMCERLKRDGHDCMVVTQAQ